MLVHVRRAGLEPLGDLLQPCDQLLLGRRLAVLPLAVLVPDRPPASVFLAGRVHGDAVLQLDDLAAATGGRTPSPVYEDPPGRPGLPRAGCGDFVGILKTADAACATGFPLSCVVAGSGADGDSFRGSRAKTRTWNLPVNRRPVPAGAICYRR